MRNFITFLLAVTLAVLGIVILSQSASAGNNLQGDQITHGKYIATIAGCTFCHTPNKAEYQDPAALTIEQIKTIALEEDKALDAEKFLAGGRVFDLGPAGKVFTRNLTPDKETGIGNWTDEQVKVALKTGLAADGEVLFPVMPYHVYNGMGDSDVDAVVAFLRSINAVSNKVPKRTVSTAGISPLPYPSGTKVPSTSDPAARGAYLVNNVMGCTDCHTPVDPATGAPVAEKYLAGRQPYEGPWGIVYGGNITPDDETGIGKWNEEEIKRAIVTGIGRDGRRLILMPWYVYTSLTREDADAVVYFLKHELPAVKNQVAAPSLKPEFNVVVAPNTAPESAETNSPLLWGGIAAIIVIFAALGFVFFRRKAS